MLPFTTARLECKCTDGTISTGTGFFFNYVVDKDHGLRFLMTNKHVIEDAYNCTLYVHEAEQTPHGTYRPLDNSFTITINGMEYWSGHPDPDIDLCAIPIEPLHREIEDRHKVPFYTPFEESLIPTRDQMDSLRAIEDVFMVGYPIGLMDKVNNLPIIRRGITASHPAIGRFLRLVNDATPDHKQLHLIADNYATHKHPAVQPG